MKPTKGKGTVGHRLKRAPRSLFGAIFSSVGSSNSVMTAIWLAIHFQGRSFFGVLGQWKIAFDTSRKSR